MEPRLVVFQDHNGRPSQGFIIAEQDVLFEVTEFSIIKGLISLIAAYYSLYIGYPKSTIAACRRAACRRAAVYPGTSPRDRHKPKKRLKYTSLINSIVD